MRGKVKEWKENNKDKMAAQRLEESRKKRAQLSDRYIVENLKKVGFISKTPYPEEYINSNVIEMKRVLIQIKRKIREIS